MPQLGLELMRGMIRLTYMRVLVLVAMVSGCAAEGVPGSEPMHSSELVHCVANFSTPTLNASESGHSCAPVEIADGHLHMAMNWPGGSVSIRVEETHVNDVSVPIGYWADMVYTHATDPDVDQWTGNVSMHIGQTEDSTSIDATSTDGNYRLVGIITVTR